MRSAELAATPPPMTTVSMPVRSRGPQQLGDEHVDDRGLERRGDVGDLGVGMLAHPLHHRGLQPGEREVVAVVEHRARERDRASGRPRSRAGRSPGRRDSRARGTARPCRRPRRPRRRRSGRARGNLPWSSIATSSVCPPDAISVSSGGSSVGSSSSAAYMCASWWLTPTYGVPVASASAFAALTPTMQRAGEAGPVHGRDDVDVARARCRLRPAPRRSRRRSPRRARGSRPRARHRRSARAGRPGSRRPTSASCDRRRRPRPRSRRTTSRCRGSRVTTTSAARRRVVPGTRRSRPCEQLLVRGRVDLVGPHHERVLTGVGVVALADADRHEAEPPVHLLRGLVRQPRLRA